MLIKAIVFVILLLVGRVIVNLLINLEIYKQDLLTHTPGPCRIVPGEGIGYEDMETLPNGLTLITSGLIMPNASPKVRAYIEKKRGRGRIYLFDFNNPEKNIEELQFIGETFDPSDFAPHGISVRTSKTGTVLVLVVNHRKNEDTIEKFEFDLKKRQLKHLHTYKDPAINFINDVTMDSDSSFYFTNYQFYRGPTIMATLEIFLPLRYGSLIYFDGNKYIEQDNGLQLPNGLIVSPDSQFVYMMQSVCNLFYVYKRQSNGTLTRYQSVQLSTGADNPTIDKDGNVLFGAHPITWKVAMQLDDPEYPSPSQASGSSTFRLHTDLVIFQVIKLHMDKGKVTKITEVLSVDGDFLSASTVASSYKNGLLVGTIQHKLMYCEVRWMD